MSGWGRQEDGQSRSALATLGAQRLPARQAYQFSLHENLSQLGPS